MAFRNKMIDHRPRKNVLQPVAYWVKQEENYWSNTSFPIQKIYDRFDKILMGGSSYGNNMITKCVGKGGSLVQSTLPYRFVNFSAL